MSNFYIIIVKSLQLTLSSFIEGDIGRLNKNQEAYLVRILKGLAWGADT